MQVHLTKNRGIALLIVLTALTILSAAVVEFAYNEQVVFTISENEQDGAQAYYLANSAVTLAKLVLKYDKEFSAMADSAAKKYNTKVDIPHLYDLVPLNTQLFRQMGQMAPPAAEGEPTSGSKAPLGVMDSHAIDEFLNFSGDFSSTITQEETKININAFYAIDPRSREYIRLKSTLSYLLLGDEFKDLFNNRFKDAPELAGNIANYIDKDDVLNGPKGEEMGGETKTKNARLLSLSELNLVEGMTPKLYLKLSPYITLYAKDYKILACRAKNPIIKAMVLSYAEDNPSVEKIALDNNELLGNAVKAVKSGCPEKNNMAKNLSQVLGVDNSSSTAPSGGTVGSGRAGANSGFADMITSEGTFYSVNAEGSVGLDMDHLSLVKINTVFDTQNPDPAQWKPVYWRVE